MSKVQIVKRNYNNLSVSDSANHVLSQMKAEIMRRPWARDSEVLVGVKQGLFEIEPVGTKEFFDSFYLERNYPRQQDLMDAMFGTDPTEWNTDYSKFIALWGMGGGKDHTVAKAFVYAAYWLLCLDMAYMQTYQWQTA